MMQFLIILDEPTAPLNLEERQELFNYILKMKKPLLLY